MSGIKSLLDKYAKIIVELPKERQRLALIYAGDAFAMVANRTQNEGIGSDGEKYPLYSRKPLPFWKLNESEFNAPSKIAKFKKDSSSGKVKPTYENLRKAYGLPTNKRTLTFDGEMFKSIEQVITRHDDLVTEVTIRAKDRVNQNKINSNSRILNQNILSFGDDEKEYLREENKKRIESYLKS